MLNHKKYATAIHEVGHAVAAYDLGFGMRKRGIILHENPFLKGRFDGTAFTHVPRIRSQNPPKYCLRADIVISFAGGIAHRWADYLFWNKIEQDIWTIKYDLGKLVPNLKSRVDNYDAEEGSELWALVCALVTSRKREKALQDLDEYYENMQSDGTPVVKIDPAIFDILWPLAQQAHAIINSHWLSVKRLACDLLKNHSLNERRNRSTTPMVRLHGDRVSIVQLYFTAK